MKYLLDVNALVAWGHGTHADNAAFHAWAARIGFSNMATCAHSELGFLRVTMQWAKFTRAEADKTLDALRKQVGGFVADCPPPRLAAWAATAAKTTDAYLCQLAAANGLRLATFDAGIKDPVAYLIR